jgi:hypothetical protein
MLREWAHYLTLPAPWTHRRLGYVRESVSLTSRSRRCRKAWRPHLEAARAVIAQSFADLPQRRTAVVLGSGLLDDVPLAALASAFEAVLLVDAVHPWATRKAVRAHANVRLATADLSGSAGWLLGGADDLADALPAIVEGQSVDLVISANLLSQLPILPIAWYEERDRTVPPDLGRRIVASHLAGLARLRTRVCLVTDVEQVEMDRAGGIVDRIDLLHGARLPPPDRTWDWELAPFGEAERHTRLVHRVWAYRDWHPA